MVFFSFVFGSAPVPKIQAVCVPPQLFVAEIARRLVVLNFLALTGKKSHLHGQCLSVGVFLALEDKRPPS